VSNQRWHEWKNLDETPCPPFGVVQLYGDPLDYGPILNEEQVIGIRFVLDGFKPGYNITEEQVYVYSLRGFDQKMAINGPLEVLPGRIGLCTFDLPTWVSLQTPATEFGTLITALDTWKAHAVTEDQIFPNTGCLRLLAAIDEGRIAYVGSAVTFMDDLNR